MTRNEKVYCCDDCGFLFSRAGEVWECPFCEGHRFRPATEEEAQRLQDLLQKEACIHTCLEHAT